MEVLLTKSADEENGFAIEQVFLGNALGKVRGHPRCLVCAPKESVIPRQAETLLFALEFTGKLGCKATKPKVLGVWV